MVREIEFRGQALRSKLWVRGYYWTNENGNHFIRQTVDLNGCFRIADIEVDPETVGQYTGVKDFNGIKIYDNDILKFLNKYSDDEPVSRSKVYTFDGTPFCIDVETGEYDVTTLAWAMEHNIEDVEVIGNIYDNPELLEKEK